MTSVLASRIKKNDTSELEPQFQFLVAESPACMTALRGRKQHQESLKLLFGDA
jgi:hypothetical protein